MLFVAINQLVNKVSVGPGGEGGGGEGGDVAAAARSAEAGGEVGSIIKRLFKELYTKGEVRGWLAGRGWDRRPAWR
mgnify:CR=1 FL=1